MYVVLSCQVQCDWPDQKPGEINGNNFICPG